MGQLPFWHSVELSAGARPILRESEVDVHVEDNIGLYQGKSKILNRQNGRLYLTSQRLIYIDNANTSKYSCSIELDDVKAIAHSSKFLRSSPKITIFFKQFKNPTSPSIKHNNKDNASIKIDWMCEICSYNNKVSVNYLPSRDHGQLSCDLCGIKPEVDYIQSLIDQYNQKVNQSKKKTEITRNKNEISCPSCTFLNHPSLRHCEICGSNLPFNDSSLKAFANQEIFDDRIIIETDSPDGLDEASVPFIKLSFHKTGDKVFHNELLETLEKFEWQKMVDHGNVNKEVVKINDQPVTPSIDNNLLRHIGIHGLSKQDDLQTQRNEEIINSSLDDLETLLNKANEILTMIDSFKSLQEFSAGSASAEKTIYNLKQEILRDSAKEQKFSLYLQEIARKISEFLINDGTLAEEGGILTLVDLFALYNRGRIGQNLISPNELLEACTLFERLKLPLILKKINEVYVVQDLNFVKNDEIINDIVNFINEYGNQDESNFYKYSNVLNISDHFNWSLTVTEEFLQIALDTGKLVIDEQIFGKHYYLNMFIDPNIQSKSTEKLDHAIASKLQDQMTLKTDESVKNEKNNLIENQTFDVLKSNFPQVSYKVPFKTIPSQPNISKDLWDLQGINFNS